MLVTTCTTPVERTLAVPGARRVRRRAESGAGTELAARRRRWHPRAVGATLRARLLEDVGFSLVELLVASVAGIVVMTATFAILESSQQVQARDAEWALGLQEDRAGLARMVRDIRQASKIEDGKASSITLSATLGGKAWQIKYECGVSQPGTTYTECVRLAAEEPSPLPSGGPVVAKNVLNGSEVFSYLPAAAPTLVTVKIKLPAKGALKQAGSTGYKHEIVLEDGAFMRNRYLEG